MIKVTTIFGGNAVQKYGENNELPSEEWLTDNGGVMGEKEFETEAEYNAYITGANDVDEWSDYHIICHRLEEADTSREENFWLCLGISVRDSWEDIERILNGDTETLRKLLDTGRYGIGGETHVPDSTVEGYNEDHDTEFEEEDMESRL